MELMTVLTIIFIVLKLVGVIDWSWFIVLLPFIIGFVVHMSFLLIFYLVNKH